LAGAGTELFLDLWQSPGLEMYRQDCQQSVAQQRQIGQEVGLAAAGTVLAHEGIAPPMVADFHSGPMSANQIKLESRGSGARRRTSSSEKCLRRPPDR